MLRRISLANKCLLLFGGAVVLIVMAALTAPWLRMNSLVEETEKERSRQLAATWLRRDDAARLEGRPVDPGDDGTVEHVGIRARRLSLPEADRVASNDPFVAGALRTLRARPDLSEVHQSSWEGMTSFHRYARGVVAQPQGGEPTLEQLVVFEPRSGSVPWLVATNTAYLLSSGSVVLGLAVLVFYLITHYIVLSPVRQLRETADRVREGDLSTRSSISTGDEFQELSETFNAMLAELQRAQGDLRSINAALDVKLAELAEANSALFEAARLKGEFLANVSHELRTPMNAIIGFAELLLEIASTEAQSEAAADPVRVGKRVRYLTNIVTAARGLLELINGLLEMAKIEAGRIDVTISRTNLAETCEGLVGLIYPLAERKGLKLRTELDPSLPLIQTDVQKLHQIVFNFLSNAVKFTPRSGPDGRQGEIVLRAERLGDPDGRGERLRVSVLDNGPGIDPKDQSLIFEKFHQLDGSHTRVHAGAGLGLAISRELAGVLQGEIQLVSELGQGSMFSLIIPVRMDETRVREAQLEARARAALAGRGEQHAHPRA